MKRLSRTAWLPGCGDLSSVFSFGGRWVVAMGLVLASQVSLLSAPGDTRNHGRKDGVSSDPVRRSVVRVIVSPARTDPVRPWIRRPGEAYATTGLVVGNGLVLIQADELRNGVLIEVSRADQYRKERARPLMIDMEANLALIRMDRAAFLNGLSPLPIGSDPVQGEEVVACRTDSLFRVYREVGRVIEYTIGSDYGFTRLPSFSLSSRESYQSGDVLMKGGRLAGVIAYQSQQGRYMAVPASRLSSFRERALAALKRPSSYRGFVVQGIELDDLVDPGLRSHLGVDRYQGGAFVNAVLPGTPAGNVLKAGDILLKLAGQSVDEKGLYRDPFLGLQKAELLLTRSVDGRYRMPGDHIEAELVRAKRLMHVRIPLHPYAGGAERIPWLLSDAMPSYLVESGLVFVDLTVPFLQARFGKDWRVRATELAYIYDEKKNYRTTREHDRVVLLSEVLPDPANVGYEHMTNLVVARVNGQPIQDVDELIRIVNEARGKATATVEVEFTDGKKVFLDPSAADANRRIQKTYRLRELSRSREAVRKKPAGKG